jgi:hypothetical protein
VDVAIARNILRRTAIIGEIHWHLGAEGDAATAIGAAWRMLRRGSDSLLSLDVAMTAVLCLAIEGEPAAALLLSAALKRRSSSDHACHALADSWLLFEPARSARNSVALETRAPGTGR